MGPLRLQLPEMVADEDGSPVMRGRLKVLGPDDAAEPAGDETEGMAEQKVASEATHPGSSPAAENKGGSHTAAEEGSTGGQTSHGGLPEDEVTSRMHHGQAQRSLASQGILSQDKHSVTPLSARAARGCSCAHNMLYFDLLPWPTVQVHSPLYSRALIKVMRWARDEI